MERSFDDRSIDQLEHDLAQPTEELVDAMRRLQGDLMVLGAAGKMGPSLCRLARRASEAADTPRAIWAVSRFTDDTVRQSLETAGVRTVQADLLEDDALAGLPESPNVVLMAGHKFGSSSQPELAWATNVLLPALAAHRYASSRIVAFSTGNVYPLTPVALGGSTEDDPVAPVGEYAVTALGRERVLTYQASARSTPMCLLRLNYAVEPRYGVLRDIAEKVKANQPIDVTMGHVNVIWQRDANAIALRALAHCGVPPQVLNVTGGETISVRQVAEAFGGMFDVEPVFEGRESTEALLSNASRCRELFGAPTVGLDEMMERVGRWVGDGGPGLGKPTHYQERGGKF